MKRSELFMRYDIKHRIVYILSYSLTVVNVAFHNATIVTVAFHNKSVVNVAFYNIEDLEIWYAYISSFRIRILLESDKLNNILESGMMNICKSDYACQTVITRSVKVIFAHRVST